MKKVLITGSGSYVGTSFETWVSEYKSEYQIDTIGTIDNEWLKYSFETYDCVLHVAGIVHTKETRENTELYYKINRDLTARIAQKAKDENVKQFIFLSTMSVYGLNKGKITKKTNCSPINAYGKSKFEAENILLDLETPEFSVAILRPPMIYGKHCKGNYNNLSNFIKKVKIFPKIENKRSMIYIDHLSFFIKNIIDNNKRGIFHPQNNEYVSVVSLAKNIAKVNNKNIIIISSVNFIINNLANHIRIFSKVFGDLYYDKDDFPDSISLLEFEETVKRTEL